MPIGRRLAIAALVSPSLMVVSCAPAMPSPTPTPTVAAPRVGDAFSIPLGATPENPCTGGNLVASTTREDLMGQDVDGNGDLSGAVLVVFEKDRRTLTIIGPELREPLLKGGIIAFSEYRTKQTTSRTLTRT